MRAAVMRGGRIEIEEVADPSPGPGKLVVAPQATGICGSDLHLRDALAAFADQAPDAVVPIVPGHEFAGEIVAIGAGTDTGLEVGDVVAVNPFTPAATGYDTIGLSPTVTGGLAELSAVDADRAVKLPADLDVRLGALCEPVAVGVHAFARAHPSGPIVVIGAGPIGLAVLAVAASAGRGPIVAVDPSPARRAMAQRLGADAVHEPGAPLLGLLEEVGFRPSPTSPLLGGDPSLATVFECVGSPAVVQAVLAEAPMHSRVVLAGACIQPVEVQPLPLTLNEVSIEASFAYRPHELAAAADLVAAHPDRFAALITSEHPLVATAQAFEALAGVTEELKILVRPQSAFGRS